ncbi:MAG: hypothetical protein U1F23_05705 [Lysobacterales bacterium]
MNLPTIGPSSLAGLTLDRVDQVRGTIAAVAGRSKILYPAATVFASASRSSGSAVAGRGRFRHARGRRAVIPIDSSRNGLAREVQTLLCRCLRRGRIAGIQQGLAQLRAKGCEYRIRALSLVVQRVLQPVGRVGQFLHGIRDAMLQPQYVAQLAPRSSQEWRTRRQMRVHQGDRMAQGLLGIGVASA